VLDLQEAVGNTATQRALSSLQDQHPTLGLGARGPDVAQIQQLLNALGARPTLATDGTFGNRTRSAVVAFQSTQGLAADGVVGPNTREALESPANAPASTGTVATPTVGAPAGPTTKGSGPVTFFVSGRPQVTGGGGLQTARQEGDELFKIAQVQFDEGDAAGALPLFQRVYSLPQQTRERLGFTAMFIAECHHKLGNFSEAIKFYQEVLVSQISPAENPQVVPMAVEGLREARAGEKLGNLRIHGDATPQEKTAANATAEQEIKAALVADPQTSLDHATKAYNQRAALFKRRFEAAVLMGDAFQKLKQFDKALDMYQEALGMPFDPGLDIQPLFFGETRGDVRDRMSDARVRQAGDKGGALEAPPMSLAEEQALFAGAVAKTDAADYRGAADDFMRLYAQKNLDDKRRASVLFNLGLTHQRLQEFDTAISEFEEFLQIPASLGRDEVVHQKIQQCRLKQVGALIQQGGATEDFLFEADVIFETGDAKQPGEPVGSTIGELAELLKQKHAGAPGGRFSITFVGHASNRFKSAKSSEEAHKRNRELSAQRAERVKELFLKELPAADVAAGVYRSTLDPEGDSEAQSLGLDREDNTWVFRRVRVIVKKG
jgi:tetratricopeptide (TPR) repeat protein